MRKKLAPSPRRCLQIIHGLLPMIGAEKYAAFVSGIREAMARLTETPTSLNDLVDYFNVIQVTKLLRGQKAASVCFGESQGRPSQASEAFFFSGPACVAGCGKQEGGNGC